MAELAARGADAARVASDLAAQKTLHVSRRHPGRLVILSYLVILTGGE